jgi:hypothetical protein
MSKYLQETTCRRKKYILGYNAAHYNKKIVPLDTTMVKEKVVPVLN